LHTLRESSYAHDTNLKAHAWSIFKGFSKQKSAQKADTAAATNLKELTAALRLYI
jgi:hypothetical protein